tara:strand:+ start:178 stop:585 length:408 start_codon:yes stop_codon:yes gene_type:complete
MNQPVSGQVILDVGAAVETFFPRPSPMVSTYGLVQAVPDTPEDPFVFVQWARYHQARLLGEDVYNALEKIRKELSASFGHNDIGFLAHLIRVGDDVRQLILKDKKVLTTEDIERIDYLLNLEPEARWEALAACVH